MKLIFLTLLIAFVQTSYGASELPAVNNPKPYQKDAVIKSLICLDTSRGDEERIAKLRNWVAENLSYLGDV